MNEQQDGRITTGAPVNGARSFTDDPESIFNVGLVLLNKQNVRGAMHKFEEAFRLNPSDARYASYYGYCLARVDKRVVRGETLCARAVEQDFFRADLFYNLGRVRLLMDDRRSAREAFVRGLSVDRGHRPIIQELKRMGVRRRPVFPFLDRGHVLNKVSGMVLTRVGLR